MLAGPSRDISCLRRGRSRTTTKGGGEAWKILQRSLLPDLRQGKGEGTHACSENDQEKEKRDHEKDDTESYDEEGKESDEENIEHKRHLPVRKTRRQNISDESEDSDEESERAKRKRAFRAFKESRSSTKKENRIKGRPKGDNTDTEEDDAVMDAAVKKSKKQLEFVENVEEHCNSSADSMSGPSFPRKVRKVKINGIISDSEESDSKSDVDSGTDNSFIDDGDSTNTNESQNDNHDWAGMLENLKRRGAKFDELNNQYEESAQCRQLGGYDLSDDEERENKYPPRLLDDLREAIEAASKDDGVQVAPELEEDNNKLIQMWEMYDVAESKEKEGECVCGRTGLRWLYFMRVKGLSSWPFHTRVVGSECIRWFCRGNPRSILSVFSRLLKEGCVSTYMHQLDTKCLIFQLGGNILPPFLREHKDFHKTEYNLPVLVHDEDEKVDIIVKPGTQGRVKDEAGKLLVKGGKYQMWVRPAVRPCKDSNKIPTLDFVLVKVQDMKDIREVGGKEKSGKDFLK